MNQCTNTRAASLERCKRMPAPLLRTLSPSSFLDLLHFPEWLPFFSLSPFPSLTATYLSYSLSPLCSHPTSLWQMYSFLPLLYSIILPLSCYLICSFYSLFISFCDPRLYWGRCCHHFYFLPPCSYSSFPGLSPNSLSSLIVFKEWKRKKKCVQRKERAKERWRW